MYCKKCGHENDADAAFCEKCGANLGSTPSQETSTGMSRNNKILIVVVIVLVLGIGITTGMLLTSKAPIVNNTTNNTTVNTNTSNKSPESVSDYETSTTSNSESIYADPDVVYSKAKEYVKDNYPPGYTVTYPELGNLAANGTYYSYYMGVHDSNDKYVRTLKASAYSGELFP